MIRSKLKLIILSNVDFLVMTKSAHCFPFWFVGKYAISVYEAVDLASVSVQFGDWQLSIADYQLQLPITITDYNYRSESKAEAVIPQPLAGANLHKLATRGIIDLNYWPLNRPHFPFSLSVMMLATLGPPLVTQCLCFTWSYWMPRWR